MRVKKFIFSTINITKAKIEGFLGIAGLSPAVKYAVNAKYDIKSI
jgi:hypothetical protein